MAQLVKTVQGLAIASVKTVQGLAIASVKTINGLDNTSGGGGAWTYSVAVAGTDSDDTSNSGVAIYGQITLTAGTVSKVSVYSANCGSGNIKAALYDSSRALLGNGSVASPNDASPHDLEISITPVVIGNGTFYVGFQSDAGNQTWRYATATGTMYYFVDTYANFPQDPFDNTNTLSRNYRVGAFIA